MVAAVCLATRLPVGAKHAPSEYPEMDWILAFIHSLPFLANNTLDPGQRIRAEVSGPVSPHLIGQNGGSIAFVRQMA